MTPLLAAAVPTGDRHDDVQAYFEYLYRYFSDQVVVREWLLDWGIILVEFGWVAALVLFFLGWSRFTHTQWGGKRPGRDGGKPRVYPVARFDQITERAGGVSTFQLFLYAALVLSAMFFVVRTILEGYVYERF